MNKKYKAILSWIICIATVISVFNLPALTTIVKAETIKEVQNIHWGDASKGEVETSVYCDPVQGADRYVVEFAYGAHGGAVEGTSNCIDMKNRVLGAGEGETIKITKVDVYIGQIHLATANVEIGKQFKFNKIPTPIVSLNKHESNDSDYWDVTWTFHKKPTYYFFKVVEDFEVDASGNIEFSKIVSSLGQSYNSESACKVDFSSFSNEIVPGKVYGFMVKAYYGPDDEFASDEGYYEYVAEKEAIKNITWSTDSGSSKAKLYWTRMPNVDTYLIFDNNKELVTSSNKNEIDMTPYIDFEDMSKNQFYIRAYRGATEYSVLSAVPAYDYGINLDFNNTAVVYNTGDEPEELKFAAHDSCHGGIKEYQVHSIIGGEDRIINSKSYKTTSTTINNVEEKIISIKPDTSVGRVTEYYVTYYCSKHSDIEKESQHTTVTVHDSFAIISNSGDAKIYQGSNAAVSLDVSGTGVSCTWTVDGAEATGKQNGKTFYLDTLSALAVGEHNIVATVEDIIGQTLSQSYKITVLESNANHVPMKISKSRVNGYVSLDNPVINLVDVDEIAFTYEWQTDGYAADKIPVIGTISYDWSIYPIKEDGYPDIDNCLLAITNKATISDEDLASLAAGEYGVLSSVTNTIVVDGKEYSSAGIVAFTLNTTPHSHVFNTGYTQLDALYHNVYCECGNVKVEKHNWDQAIYVEADYYNEGKKVCEDCGYIEITPQLECNSHTYIMAHDSKGHYNKCTLCGYETAHVAHTRSTLESDIIEFGIDASCTTDGTSDVVKCGECDYIFPAEKVAAIGHKYANIVSITKATLTSNGKTVTECTRCGKTTTATIYYPKTVKLDKVVYTYDGKAKKPSVIIKDSKGKVIPTSSYSVTYPSSCKKVGEYTVKVTFKGNYKGSKSLTYKINPVKVAISSLTAGSKSFTAKWAKKTSEVTGYQLQYSTSDRFKTGNKTVTITKNSTVKKQIKNLKAGKKYFARIRTYKTVGNVKFYSEWSAKKAVTTKK